MDRQETLYTMALTRIRGLSLRNALTLYRAVGGATAIFNELPRLRKRFPEFRTKLLTALERGTADALVRAENEMRFCETHAVKVLCLNDAAYPARLRECDDAPLCLYYRGTADLNAAHVVSIVGTRRCTEYGKDLCRRLTSDLAALCPDTLVISGLAYGIDIHAHRGALDNGLPTVAILAHGLDRIYPGCHRDTAKTMLERGGLVTEYPTGTRPDKGNFVCRNRIVAGLCDACIVVESARKGGSIITARLAFDYNRQVYACPGRLNDEFSQGCNSIIHDTSARLLSSVDDFVKDMGWYSEEKFRQVRRRGVQTELFPQLGLEEQAIADFLRGTDGQQINNIAQALSMPVQQVSSLIFQMEMSGLIKRLPGSVYGLVQ